LSGQQAIQRSVQPILGHGTVRDPEQIFESGRGIPVFSQGKLTAWAAKAIDDLDSHDVGGPNGLFALRHVPVDDLVEAQQLPEPESKPDVAEPTPVSPTD
jgi:hypothetical protein